MYTPAAAYFHLFTLNTPILPILYDFFQEKSTFDELENSGNSPQKKIHPGWGVFFGDSFD